MSRKVFLLLLCAFAKTEDQCPDERMSVFHDHWGYPVTWRDPEDGWDEAKREAQLQLHLENTLQPRLVPSLTDTGFKMADIPEDLYEFILDHRKQDDVRPEPCPPSAHYNCFRLDPATGERIEKRSVEVIGVRDAAAVKQRIMDQLRPLAEEWTGIELIGSAVYGIRRYLRGSWLALHVDRLNTHVVSFILQIDQLVDEEWPLTMVDLRGRKQKIVLRPGDMVMYEGAKVLHGRQFPLKGKFFDNIFVHFRPKKIWYKEKFSEKFKPEKIFSKRDLV